MAEVNKKNENDITWLQVNNIVPIIASAIMIASTFWSLKTDVKVLTERVNTMIENQGTATAQRNSLESRLGNLSLKVQALETKLEGEK